MPTLKTAIAEVATPAPGRYAKQLLDHLGRRTRIVAEPGGSRLVFDDGQCLIEIGSSRLVLHASSADMRGLQRVTEVVGSHLERFGRRNELLVRWAIDDAIVRAGEVPEPT